MVDTTPTTYGVVLACIACEMGGRPLACIEHAARQLPDWRGIHVHAWSNGVIPLVHRQLSSVAQRSVVPGNVLEDLAAEATRIATVNLVLTADLLELLDALDGAGVRAIAYKGPVLATRAYGNLALRHYNDLDILIPRAEMDMAAPTLRRLGYALHDPVGSTAEHATRLWGHHFSFLRDATLVEVHWRFYKPLFGSHFPEEEIWNDAGHVSVAGRNVRALSVQHELLVIATHGSWHGWSQLSWVCDFAALLRGMDAAQQVPRLLDTARRFGCVRPLLLGFELVHTLLDVELPPVIRNETSAHPAVRDAAAVVRRRLQAGAGPDTESARLQLALRERLRDKLSFAARALFQPNPSDVRAIRLPYRLFPLYYAIRPVRIAARYRRRRPANARQGHPEEPVVAGG